MAHGAVNIAFGLGAGAVVATGSEADPGYVAGESGIAGFTAVVLVGAVLLARAKVWRTDAPAAPAIERDLEPVA